MGKPFRILCMVITMLASLSFGASVLAQGQGNDTPTEIETASEDDTPTDIKPEKPEDTESPSEPNTPNVARIVLMMTSSGTILVADPSVYSRFGWDDKIPSEPSAMSGHIEDARPAAVVTDSAYYPSIRDFLSAPETAKKYGKDPKTVGLISASGIQFDAEVTVIPDATNKKNLVGRFVLAEYKAPEAARPDPPKPMTSGLTQLAVDSLMTESESFPKAYKPGTAMFVYDAEGKLLTAPPKEIDENDEVFVSIVFASEEDHQARTRDHRYEVIVTHPDRVRLRSEIARVEGSIPGPSPAPGGANLGEQPDSLAPIAFGNHLMFPLGKFVAGDESLDKNSYVRFEIRRTSRVLIEPSEPALKTPDASPSADPTTDSIRPVPYSYPVFTVIREEAFAVNPVYQYAYRIGPVISNVSDFDDSNIVLVDNTDLSDGTLRQEIASISDPKNTAHAAVLTTIYLKPRDLRKDPDTFWDRINPVVGAAVDSSIGKNFYLGADVEMARGFNMTFGANVAEVESLQRGVRVGDVFPAGTTRQNLVRQHWKTGFYWGISMDAAILGDFVKQVIAPMFNF